MDEVSEILETHLSNYVEIQSNETLEQIIERRLPKICYDTLARRQIDPILVSVDVELSKKIKNLEPSILELHKLIHCGASTVIELCKKAEIPVYDYQNLPNTFPEEEDAQKELYRVSQKKFRQLLFNGETKKPVERPSVEEIEGFWSDLWSKTTTYNPSAEKYIEAEEKRMKNVTKFSCDVEITLKDLKKALKKKKSWSPPGVDGIQTFWYKRFKSVHQALIKCMNKIIDNPEENMPKFFTQGFTELFPKTEDTKSASKYRPITHLPAIYKIITRCIQDKIFAHYNHNKVLADEQCGGRRGYFGLRMALIVDSIALSKEPLWGCYVDFKKAFDMVPHSWILEMLRVYKVDDIFVDFLEKSMQNWNTRLYLNSSQDYIFTEKIELKKGIFQGDSLSVLLYWTAMNPLSFALNSTGRGLELKNGRLSHLLYMDDLKLYSSKLEDLKIIFKTVEEFSMATSMELNYEKTHVYSLPKEEIKTINFDNCHLKYSLEETYLGYKQDPKIDHEEVIKNRTKSFGNNCEKIEKTKLSDEDKATFRVKYFIIYIVVQTFGFLHWTVFEGHLLEVKCTKKRKMRIVDGLKDVYLMLIHEILKMRNYFYLRKLNSNLIKLIMENDNNVTPLNLASNGDNINFMESLKNTFKEKKTPKREAEENEQDNKRRNDNENYSNLNQ